MDASPSPRNEEARATRKQKCLAPGLGQGYARHRLSLWCPAAESNYGLILTMDLLCHLTSGACCFCSGRMLVEEPPSCKGESLPFEVLPKFEPSNGLQMSRAENMGPLPPAPLFPGDAGLMVEMKNLDMRPNPEGIQVLADNKRASSANSGGLTPPRPRKG